MRDKVKRAKNAFTAKMRKEWNGIQKVWDFIATEYEPYVDLNNRLETDAERVAKDQERASYVASSKVRTVDMAGKQAKRLSYSYVQKARDFSAKMMSQFRSSLTDDRKNFLKKVTSLQQK